MDRKKIEEILENQELGYTDKHFDPDTVDELMALLSQHSHSIIQKIKEGIYGTAENLKPVGVIKDTSGKPRNYIFCDELDTLLSEEEL